MPTEDDPLFIPNAEAMWMLSCGPSKYWGHYVRNGKVIVVGSGKGSRAYHPSVRACAKEEVAEAKAARGAVGNRPDPTKSARMAAIWAARKNRRNIAAE